MRIRIGLVGVFLFCLQVLPAWGAEGATPPAMEKPSSAPHAIEGMVLVRGGCYEMGDREGDGSSDEKPVHEVCVDDFYMGKTEVTQKEWQEVMGNNPSRVKDCDSCPVDHVSWEDAKEYIARLKEKTGRSYRLPTEAEWEYAARDGGKGYKYGWGDGAPSGNIADESMKKKFPEWAIWNGYDDGRVVTAPAASYAPNGLGLYDLTGNVWEWVEDWYSEGYYRESPRDDPRGPEAGEFRVLRGGSWNNKASSLRNANRDWGAPDFRFGNIGFRLVVSLKSLSDKPEGVGFPEVGLLGFVFPFGQDVKVEDLLHPDRLPVDLLHVLPDRVL
ncbi:MAG: formylglycine-generating enzyme family protein [Nitrospirae bacterium]|nr:formylglycine-generating enzyme family protein [Nitrospirota bacterium]